jgi:hypothetical protein
MTIAGSCFASEAAAAGLAGALYALDSSGNGAHGLVSGATPGLSGGTGRMFDFDGVDDRIDCPAVIGTGNLTIECFAENVVDGTQRALVTCDDPSQDGWMLQYGAFNEPVVRDEPLHVFQGNPPGAGVHHVAFTYDGTHIRVYVNGVLDAGPSARTFAGDNSPITIGASLARSWFHDGRLSEVAIYNSALTLTRIAAHFAARFNAGDYAAAVLADTPVGYWRLNEAAPVPEVDAWALRPILTELNGVDVRDAVAMDSFSKQDTLGQPVSATLTLRNPMTAPQAGDRVRVLYHQSVEFAGTIGRVRKRTDDLQITHYECDLVDWAQILVRRQVRRNFVSMTVLGIVESVLDNELAGELLTIGTIDSRVMVPLVDASAGARVFDLFRDLGSATGQSFRVEFDQSLRFTSTTVETAPLLLNESNVLVEATEITRDRDTYRNVQTVIVTGTPATTDEDPLVLTVQRTNEDQIAERQAIEGGTGRYEELESITHPISNRLEDLLIMGNGYGDLRLAISGALRTLLTVQVRGYGFRAGQVATVELPTFGISGEFMVQRVSLQERAGQFLFHTLELVESSMQRRAYESWLTILAKGKIAISLFGTIAHDSVTFTTPGAANWTVPAGVTVITITAKGGSGGGAGGATTWVPVPGGCFPTGNVTGGKGGNSGKAISSVNVLEGQEFNLFIGTRGSAGTGGNTGCIATPVPTGGTAGTPTTVFRSGVSMAEAFGGGGGVPPPTPAPGAPGGGSGSIVTVGGGKTGGAGGSGTSNGTIGQHGSVTIEW